MPKIQVDKIDDRLRSVSALTLFLIALQLLKTTSAFFFPELAPTITEMIKFYLPLTLAFLIGLLYHIHYRTRILPAMPTAWQTIKRYAFWFVVFWILTFVMFLTGFFGLSSSTFGMQTVQVLGIGSFVLNFIVAVMENLPLVLIAPILFNFNIGGTGIIARIVEYIPAGIIAAMSHMSVYWVQAQLRIQQLQAQGVAIDVTSVFIWSLVIAYIAFTIFYLVYKKWGFAASVALHQTFNMNNILINGG